jgi:hypothetical protein
MTWMGIMFEPGMKTHAVHESMQDAVLKELLARGAVLFDPSKREGYDPVQFAPIKPCDSWYLEFGGMIHKDEPSIDIDTIDGLKIEARADHVSLLILTLKKLLRDGGPRFLDDGRPYRKVYAWTSCIVVTPTQFDQLLASCERVAPEAERLVAAFFDEVERKHKEKA